MGNDLALLKERPVVSAETLALAQENANIKERASTPTLSFEGKVWAISVDGVKTKLMKKNAEGDEEPVPVFRGIILNYNQDRGRAYYEGNYDPAKIAAPTCWSEDSKIPHPSVKEKQNPTCQGCKWSEKGSRISDNGKATMACQMHRMIAIVPTARPDFQPLRMKISITSDWDDQSPDHKANNWYAFQNYTKVLVAHNVPNTAMLSTKIRFDPNVAYPKLLFGVDKWLDDELMRKMILVGKSDPVLELLKGTWTPAGADGKRVDAAEDDGDAAAGLPPAGKEMGTGGAEAAIKKAAEEAAAAEAKRAEAQEKAEKAAKAKAKREAKEAAEKAAAQAAAQAATASSGEDDEDGLGALDGEVIPPTKPAAAAAAAPSKPSPEAPSAAPASSEIASMLSTWDTDD